jgi:PKD repeat protein
LDGDKKGNVCDEDIDGDGKPNPVRLVDDNDHIIVGKRDNTTDQTPLGDNKQGFGLLINIDTLGEGFPTKVIANVLTDGDLKTLQWEMGDGKSYTTENLSLLHTYSAPGNYLINVIGTDKRGKKAEASTNIYIGEGEQQHYQLTILPKFSFKANKTIEYTFQSPVQGNIDHIVRTFNGKESTEKLPTEGLKKTFASGGTIIVNAKAYVQNTLKAVASFTLHHASSPVFSYLNVTTPSLQTPAKLTTNLVGKKLQDIQSILRNRGDGTTTSGRNLIEEHLYSTSGIKTVQQTMYFTNGERLTSLITFFVKNPFKTQSVALNIQGSTLSYPQYQPLKFSLSLLPKTLKTALQITNTFSITQSESFANPTIENIKLQKSYEDKGNKTLTSFGQINRCVSVFNQGTVHITTTDICLTALKNGTLKTFKCDMDNDGIADICDEDIDGDGMKNEL